MRNSWNRTRGEQPARAAFFTGNRPVGATPLSREMHVAALIQSAPQFPMEEIADDLMLKMQGGLRGFVGDAELN
jgi:hypothetical protein